MLFPHPVIILIKGVMMDTLGFVYLYPSIILLLAALLPNKMNTGRLSLLENSMKGRKCLARSICRGKVVRSRIIGDVPGMSSWRIKLKGWLVQHKNRLEEQILSSTLLLGHLINFYSCCVDKLSKVCNTLPVAAFRWHEKYRRYHDKVALRI